jgi:hypothetical protein
MDALNNHDCAWILVISFSISIYKVLLLFQFKKGFFNSVLIVTDNCSFKKNHFCFHLDGLL